MARPRIKIDWKKVESMCAIQCTLAEIASKMDVSEDTIERACKREQKMVFGDYLKRHRLKGFVSLRHKQFELAVGGSERMLIFLGKAWLGQSENPAPPMPDESEFYTTVDDEAMPPRGTEPWYPGVELPPGAVPSTAIPRPVDDVALPLGAEPPAGPIQ